MKKINKWILPAAFLISLIQLTPCFAEDPSDTLKEKMENKITVDFRDTEITDVLTMMGAQANVDIVKSPLVIGNVTAKLTDIPLGEALENILSAHGFGYILSSNMIRVLPQEEIYKSNERKISRVYRVIYADVMQVQEALKQFISKDGYIAANPGTSNIIVHDIESKVMAIDEFMNEIDRRTPQLQVEVRIYDVTDISSFNLGAEWQARFNADTPLDFSTNPATPVSSDSSVTSSGSFLPETDTGNFSLSILDSAVNLDLTLNMFDKSSGAKLLANPRIMVLDNEQASFDIIKEVPYTEKSDSSDGGSQTSTEFKEVGVKLEVKPHIGGDGNIRLHIKPEFGVLASEEREINPETGDLLPPSVDTRKLETTALLKDGQTVVLGGLKRTQSNKVTKKIPFLGDLPLLGGLFRNEQEYDETNELLVFITPVIIVEPHMSEYEAQLHENSAVPGANDIEFKHIRQERLKVKDEISELELSEAEPKKVSRKTNRMVRRK